MDYIRYLLAFAMQTSNICQQTDKILLVSSSYLILDIAKCINVKFLVCQKNISPSFLRTPFNFLEIRGKVEQMQKTSTKHKRFQQIRFYFKSRFYRGNFVLAEKMN